MTSLLLYLLAALIQKYAHAYRPNYVPGTNYTNKRKYKKVPSFTLASLCRAL